MQTSTTVAVEVTEERFRALTHAPSGTGFEADGAARWPADQFTFRLADEGAIRLLEHLHDPGLPAGVTPGETPGYPVDAVSGRLLVLDDATRARLAAAPIGPAAGELATSVGTSAPATAAEPKE